MKETDEKVSKSRPYEVQPLKSAKADKPSSANKQSLTHEQQMEIANQRLSAHEQQLNAANQQLKASNQQLQAREQQLGAANQQLRAHEQQLETANQQFQAHERLLETANQQLIALNQQLLAREQQLDSTNQQLRAHEQQLKTANEQLRVSNQQLLAREQQLDAANQQLRAHEQQLETANQNLKALNQQLDAANQQLRAVNQQLRAHEQQLDSGAQQLCAEIAERKNAEKKLLFKTTLLETQTETTLDGILVVDNKGNSVLFNKRFGQMWNIPQEILDKRNDEQMLQHILGQLKDPDAFLTRVKYLYSHKDEKSRDGVEFKNGRFFDRYSSPLVDITGKYYGRVWYFRDITETKQAEKHLKQAKDAAEAASIAKSQFLANMSHEIRTPLNTIISVSKILHKSNIDNLTAKQLEGCEIIYKSAQRLLALINDILDLSKIESGKMEVQSAPFSLDAQIAVIKSMARTLIGEKNIVFSVLKSPSITDIIVSDVYKLHEIITNIISNAIKFTDQGRIVLKIYVEGDKLYFEVSDTGIGISRHDIEHIFEEFTQVDSSNTRKYPGTGLGLAICKKMVELLGGQITAESEPGRGTTIKFWIPLKTSPVEAGDNLTEPPERNRAKVETVSLPGDVAGDSSACEVLPKILIAEDDEFGRAALRMMLEHKYQLIFAEDGQEVVEKYFSVSPDIVLMDIMMPVMDGYQAFGEINKKSSKPLIPIIALTAKAMIEDRDQLLGFGFSDYVSKPIDDDTLIKTIDKYLDETNRGLT